MVIGAAWGLGEAIVSGSVNTDQIVVAKADRTITARETADKAVMTVRTADGTAEVPVPPERRRQPVLDAAAVAELVDLGVRIEQHYGAPQDIEWARAGGELFIVQARAITALPPAEADPPTDWSVPNPKGMYVRASIVEQLPDPLSPLFADLVDGAVTHSLRALMTELLGRDVVRDGDVGHAHGERLRVLLLQPVRHGPDDPAQRQGRALAGQQPEVQQPAALAQLLAAPLPGGRGSLEGPGARGPDRR